MAYVVSQRTREIGIRIALGATAGRVIKGIAIAGLRPVMIGMVVGLAGGADFRSCCTARSLFPDRLISFTE